jgi:hypothetical protein
VDGSSEHGKEPSGSIKCWDLVVRVHGCRPRGPGSIPGATKCSGK